MLSSTLRLWQLVWKHLYLARGVRPRWRFMFSLSDMSWLHLLRGLPPPCPLQCPHKLISLSSHSCPKYLSFLRIILFCRKFSGILPSSFRMEMFVVLSGNSQNFTIVTQLKCIYFFSTSLFILHFSDPKVAIWKIRDLMNFSLVSLLLPLYIFLIDLNFLADIPNPFSI